MIYVFTYTSIMKTSITPESILNEIGNIARIERGNLSVIREGSTGPFYNMQYRENGKNKTVYVPRDQVNEVRENTENYKKACVLFERFIDVKSTQAREQRLRGKKNG